MNRAKRAVMTFCVFGILFGIEVVTFSVLPHTIAWETGVVFVLTMGCIAAYLVAVHKSKIDAKRIKEKDK